MADRTFREFLGEKKPQYSERGLSIQMRLERRREIDPVTDCWIYTGAKSAKGYGKIKLGGRNGKFVSTHRLAYEVYKGVEPQGEVVMHKCGNKSCFNPEHLVDGTYSENNFDAWIARDQNKLK